MPVVAEYKVPVIAISNDERGISYDAKERFAIAKRIVDRAATYGIPPEDVIIDPLQLCLVGAVDSAGRTLFTIVRMIREELGCNTMCGASNISFGMPNRPLLNATFVAMAIAAGMTCAITNPLEKEIRHAIYAADALNGNDESSMRYLAAMRGAENASVENSGAEIAGPERDARRTARRGRSG